MSEITMFNKTYSLWSATFPFSVLYLPSFSRGLRSINRAHVARKRILGCEGQWLSAIFQVKRPGMHQQQVAPLWVPRVLHDSDSFGVFTMVKWKGEEGSLQSVKKTSKQREMPYRENKSPNDWWWWWEFYPVLSLFHYSVIKWSRSHLGWK